MSIELVAPDGTEDERASRYIVDHVVPGSTLERDVTIGNDGDAPVDVELSVGGSEIVEHRLVFDDEGTGVEREIVEWAQLPRDRVTVAPRESVTVPVELVVPPDAEDGERYGVVWAAVRSTSTGAATVVNRVGVRIYLSVGDGPAPPSDFTVDLVAAGRADDGAPYLDVTLSNVGGRAVEPQGTVTFAGKAGEIEPGFTLTPADSGELRVRFDDDAARADAGEVDVVLGANGVDRRATAEVAFPTTPGRRAGPVVAEPVGAGDRARTLPTAIAAAMAAVVAVTAARARRGRI